MTKLTTASLASEVNNALLVTDELAEELERRVAALEEVAATRWPARIRARHRLRCQLVASIAGFPGTSFFWRRVEAATIEWLLQVRALRAGIPDD
jgi:hypothetical protein